MGRSFEDGFIQGAMGGAVGGFIGYMIGLGLKGLSNDQGNGTASNESPASSDDLNFEDHLPDRGPGGVGYGGPGRTQKRVLKQAREYRNVKSKATNKSRLNYSTVGKNIWGLTYTGPNNPKSFDGKDNFDFVPINLADYPSIGHDRRYFNLGIEGANGLLFNSRGIGADWHFVLEEMFVTIFSPIKDLKSKSTALGVGIGLGILSSPKTIYHLYTIGGRNEAIMWYIISSKGVTNKPTRRR